MKISLILILFILLANCSSTDELKKPVNDFREASKTVVFKTKDYFLSINRLERDFKFLEISSDKLKDVDDSFTQAVFTPEGIQARLKVLTIIDLYTARLVEIISTEPDEKLTRNTTILSESLKNLSSVISKITGDGSIKEYTNTVVPLIGVVTSLWEEQERKKALIQAVDIAAPIIDKIIGILEQDLKSSNEYRKEYLLSRYNEIRKKYNQDRSILNDFERRAIIQELKFLYDAYEILLALSPEDILASMRLAHTAFVKLAKDLKDKESLKNFISAVNNFSARVNEASITYHNFKNMIR